MSKEMQEVIQTELDKGWYVVNMVAQSVSTSGSSKYGSIIIILEK